MGIFGQSLLYIRENGIKEEIGMKADGRRGEREWGWEWELDRVYYLATHI